MPTNDINAAVLAFLSILIMVFTFFKAPVSRTLTNILIIFFISWAHNFALYFNVTVSMINSRKKLEKNEENLKKLNNRDYAINKFYIIVNYTMLTIIGNGIGIMIIGLNWTRSKIFLMFIMPLILVLSLFGCVFFINTVWRKENPLIE